MTELSERQRHLLAIALGDGDRGTVHCRRADIEPLLGMGWFVPAYANKMPNFWRITKEGRSGAVRIDVPPLR